MYQLTRTWWPFNSNILWYWSHLLDSDRCSLVTDKECRTDKRKDASHRGRCIRSLVVQAHEIPPILMPETDHFSNEQVSCCEQELIRCFMPKRLLLRTLLLCLWALASQAFRAYDTNSSPVVPVGGTDKASNLKWTWSWTLPLLKLTLTNILSLAFHVEQQHNVVFDLKKRHSASPNRVILSRTVTLSLKSISQSNWSLLIQSSASNSKALPPCWMSSRQQHLLWFLQPRHDVPYHISIHQQLIFDSFSIIAFQQPRISDRYRLRIKVICARLSEFRPSQYHLYHWYWLKSATVVSDRIVTVSTVFEFVHSGFAESLTRWHCRSFVNAVSGVESVCGLLD